MKVSKSKFLINIWIWLMMMMDMVDIVDMTEWWILMMDDDDRWWWWMMMIDDDDGYDGYEAFIKYTCLFVLYPIDV